MCLHLRGSIVAPLGDLVRWPFCQAAYEPLKKVILGLPRGGRTAGGQEEAVGVAGGTQHRILHRRAA